jgi:hypothetical protein
MKADVGALTLPKNARIINLTLIELALHILLPSGCHDE